MISSESVTTHTSLNNFEFKRFLAVKTTNGVSEIKRRSFFSNLDDSSLAGTKAIVLTL